MKLYLYNSLSDTRELFVPIQKRKASLYVCGPTVYNHAHIGNFRPIIVFSILKQLLKYLGYKVTLVSNYTDIDDRIIQKALKNSVDEMTVSNQYIKAYEQVLKGLNIKKPDIQPRVSAYIPQIIDYIKQIIVNGSAYVVNGDVYFRVDACPNYGCLSNVRLDENEVGARIEENVLKENPADFAIWKRTDFGIRWSSPWSEGRPGWHTECSVMINSIFKATDGLIDIHGGGFDLKFPHHENEIAQSEAHNNHQLAHYWLHNGFVNVNGEKMSKSIGNVLLGKDAIKQFGGEIVKFTILSTHYRAPINLTDDTFTTAKNELTKLNSILAALSLRIQLMNGKRIMKKTAYLNDFFEAMCDDLNISNALTAVYALIKDANISLRKPDINLKVLEAYYSSLSVVFDVLGLKKKDRRLSEEDRLLCSQYFDAKARKDFEKSDFLRKVLIERDILL